MTTHKEALEAAAVAIHDHWQNGYRTWSVTCEKLPLQADDFRAKAQAVITAYLSAMAGESGDVGRDVLASAAVFGVIASGEQTMNPAFASIMEDRCSAAAALIASQAAEIERLRGEASARDKREYEAGHKIAIGVEIELAAAEARATRAEERIAEMDAALEWYGENARLCRLIHSGGDAGRSALAEDGGKRARAIRTRGE